MLHIKFSNFFAVAIACYQESERCLLKWLPTHTQIQEKYDEIRVNQSILTLTLQILLTQAA